MPAGYPIADDLDTNSAQQALSAKQGKRLGDYLFGKDEVAVDLSGLTKITGLIIGPGSNAESNTFQPNANYECVLLPCNAGETYTIAAQQSIGFGYAVLTNNVLTTYQIPSFAAGYTVADGGRKWASGGTTATIEIPAGGKYLWLLVTNGNTDCTPTITEIVDSAGINSKIAEVAGSEVGEAQGKFAILIAAADAPDWQKAKADYVCTGVDDQDVIQSVINGFAPHGGHIILSDGNFFIDHFRNTRFTSGDCAIMLPQTMTEFYIEGATFNMGFGMKPDNDYIGMKRGGTTINVSFDCYDAMASDKNYYVFGAVPPSNGQSMSSVVALHMENIRINLPHNQKKITCIDCKYTARVYLQFLTCVGYISGYNGQSYDNNNPNPIAAEGCVGIRGLGGANWGTCADFRNIGVFAFNIGFDLSGEHIVGINLSSIRCFRGYRFAGYNASGPVGHPMTLINCCDEQSNCGPYFGKWSIVQEIDLIGWNEERGGSSYPYDPNDETESVTKQGHRWQNATEAYKTDNSGNYVDKDGNITTDPTQYVPRNAVHGRIDYTVYTSSAVNSEGESFWEPGFGYGTISKNMAHKLEYPSTTLKNSGFKCDYMERFWATDLNKEVICISTNPKTLVDLNGNQI